MSPLTSPCLIIRAPCRPYTAWNEDGRYLARSRSFAELDAHMRRFSYSPVSPNSRLGRTILDKITKTGKLLLP